MTVTVGPYTFNRVRFYPDRDLLELETEPNGIGVINFVSEDDDFWFVPNNESDKFTGLTIELVTKRFRAGLTVQLPSGERVDVLGAESVLP